MDCTTAYANGDCTLPYTGIDPVIWLVAGIVVVACLWFGIMVRRGTLDGEE